MDPINALRELGREIAAHQDRQLQLEEMEGRQPQKSRVYTPIGTPTLTHWSRSPRIVGGIAAITAIAAVVSLFFLRSRESAIGYSVEGAHPSKQPGANIVAQHSTPIDFSDGSRCMISEGSQVKIAELGRSGARLAMERGRARFDVRSRPGNDWRVFAGPFEVQVRGTSFDVEWKPESEEVTVTLHHGSVWVKGCGIAPNITLQTGQTLHGSCKNHRVEVVNTADSSASPTSEREQSLLEHQNGPGKAPDPIDQNSKPSPPLSRPLPPNEPNWRVLAEQGRFEAAYAAAEAAGFERQCQLASDMDLMALGTSARLTGNYNRAGQAYLAIRKRFPKSNRAPLAAFNLARITFDQLHQYEEAVRWLNTYLTEAPHGPLAEQANARLMEAHQRAGNSTAAKAAAQQYLTRYRNGPSRKLAEQITQ